MPKNHLLKQYDIEWFTQRGELVSNERTIAIDKVIKASLLSINERFNRALLNLSKLSPFIGGTISIDIKKDYPVFYSDNSSKEAVSFMIKQLENDGYITMSSLYNMVLTHKGWNRVAELESTNKNSKKVFVAMWFSDEMKEIFNTRIKPTVDSLDKKYITSHIAEKEHNNDITDEIVAEIKTSRFVIADLTGDRGGVYYEAGFARGLGIPVILTCREDWFKKTSLIKVNHSEGNDKEYPSTTIHFDVGHLNIIVWKTPEELSERLKNRILATID